MMKLLKVVFFIMRIRFKQDFEDWCLWVIISKGYIQFLVFKFGRGK